METKKFKLSDAFEKESERACVEFKAEMININFEHNKEIMEKCKILNGYAVFIDKVKKYTKKKELEEGVNQAINECIQEDNPLKEILENHRREVYEMILTEYDEVKVMKQLKEESYQEGIEQGIEKGKKKKNTEIIKNAYEMHMDIKNIANLLQLSIPEVEKIINEVIEKK